MFKRHVKAIITNSLISRFQFSQIYYSFSFIIYCYSNMATFVLSTILYISLSVYLVRSENIRFTRTERFRSTFCHVESAALLSECGNFSLTQGERRLASLLLQEYMSSQTEGKVERKERTLTF
jgi:hypothetical protein